jgi:hypothetical protein
MSKKKRQPRGGEYDSMPKALMYRSRRMNCEVCRAIYGRIVDSKTFATADQCIDHIFPVRFLRRLKLDPHVEINMISICGICHARKLKHEDKIFTGDVLSFMNGLNRIGYPLDRVRAAAEHYGFVAVGKWVTNNGKPENRSAV